MADDKELVVEEELPSDMSTEARAPHLAVLDRVGVLATLSAQKVYDPADWYWLVSNRPGQVFSSAKPGWVPENDPTLAAWMEAGGLVRTIMDAGEPAPDGELAWTLWNAKLPNAVVAAVGLEDWGGVPATDKLSIVCAVGAKVTDAAHPELSFTYELCGQDWNDMLNEVLYIQAMGSFSGDTPFVWVCRDGIASFASTDDFKSLAAALGRYMTAWKRSLAMGSAPPTLGVVSL